MPRLLTASLLCCLTLLLAPAAFAAGMTGMTVTRTATAGSYHLTLMIGPAAMMSMHAKSGEDMMGGSAAMCRMSGMKGMAKAPMCNHHVELHVKKNGKVVTNARVSITLHNMATKKTIMLPIATMMAPGKKSDFHYGNNANVPAGNYTVTVAVNGSKHSWKVTLA